MGHNKVTSNGNCSVSSIELTTYFRTFPITFSPSLPLLRTMWGSLRRPSWRIWNEMEKAFSRCSVSLSQPYGLFVGYEQYMFRLCRFPMVCSIGWRCSVHYLCTHFARIDYPIFHPLRGSLLPMFLTSCFFSLCLLIMTPLPPSSPPSRARFYFSSTVLLPFSSTASCSKAILQFC
jgi:hypothetical protein